MSQSVVVPEQVCLQQPFELTETHRRRSGWTSGGGRMASDEGGSVPSGVGYGEGCRFSSRLRGLGPAAGFGAESRPKTVLAYFEGHRTLIFTALHGMQTRSSDENSVRLSVRLPVCLSHACIVTKR